MATCKECLHYEVCDTYSRMGVTDVPADDITICVLFKPKSEYVKRERGEWKDRGNGDWSCTNCNEIFTLDVDMHPIHDCGLKFCPNCSADMRKEDNNA